MAVLGLSTILRFLTISSLMLPVDGGPMSYVVNQGCVYLAHYVKDNYIILEPMPSMTPHADVNWATWTDDAAAARYLPAELTQGLLECGTQFAFYALEAPEWLLHQHNLTATQNLVG